MIGVVDYKAGNLRSVELALEHLHVEFIVSNKAEVIEACERIIVPGVGNARSAMEFLDTAGLSFALKKYAASGKPMLGICLGAQIILESSQEDNAVCLGIIKGTAQKFTVQQKVPHIGWNTICIVQRHPILQDLANNTSFYFVHAYYPVPAGQAVIAECNYEHNFAAVIGQENVVATQFHPEKSGEQGLCLLNNFLRWKP